MRLHFSNETIYIFKYFGLGSGTEVSADRNLFALLRTMKLYCKQTWV